MPPEFHEECDSPRCREELIKEITAVDRKVDNKMDRDGSEGLYAIFQTKISRKISISAVIVLILSLISTFWSISLNVYSSEYKYADKSTTDIRLTSVEKDTEAISREQRQFRRDVERNIQEIKDIIKVDKEHQKELIAEQNRRHEEQMERIELLIKNKDDQ